MLLNRRPSGARSAKPAAIAMPASRAVAAIRASSGPSGAAANRSISPAGRYPDTHSSGNTTTFAPRPAASRARASTFARLNGTSAGAAANCAQARVNLMGRA